MREDPNDPLISRGSSLMEAEVDGEMVALHVESGACYGFNATAYRIWQLSEEPVRLSDLCAALASQYQVDAVTCERDVRVLLTDLTRDGLVRLSQV
ncbi:PqqD family protein [Sphingomonas psychrotolerans]|nr:PqqD family protein [Sphingomonas psychrotolerans]